MCVCSTCLLLLWSSSITSSQVSHCTGAKRTHERLWWRVCQSVHNAHDNIFEYWKDDKFTFTFKTNAYLRKTRTVCFCAFLASSWRMFVPVIPNVWGTCPRSVYTRDDKQCLNVRMCPREEKVGDDGEVVCRLILLSLLLLTECHFVHRPAYQGRKNRRALIISNCPTRTKTMLWLCSSVCVLY